MKTLLASFLALITLAWGWDTFYVTPPAQGALLWLIRQQALFLSGLWSIALMSLVMVLAVRPAWLEKPLGGMDRMYRLHKWAGILAISFAIMHWLLDMSSDLLKALIGKAGRPPKFDLAGLAELGRPLAKDMGEWIIYALIAMLLITLWKRFPYKFWRYLHRVMPVAYLGLAFHAVVLAPPWYWSQPIGMLLAVCLAAGTVASIVTLAGLIGKNRRVHGSITSIARPSATITEITCKLGSTWPGHRAGQFAFVTFDRAEGAHPFTIASADQHDGMVTFQIKALGDYTTHLADTLVTGQALTVEGPYGYFDFTRSDSQARQIWIAGGIGITPFLAWLESLQSEPADKHAADLHYFVRDAGADPFIDQLQSLCNSLPNITLHVHGNDRNNPVADAALFNTGISQDHSEVWFCGPGGLGDMLKKRFTNEWQGRFTFHQEAFEMR
ncbi:ferric reductase-like transmembrane domain-containing protein [Alcaligenaceae bacterium]|nr:ferric reductase-like transmembrane domain-containing protein [Alcaligenaceae bacterium]